MRIPHAFTRGAGAILLAGATNLALLLLVGSVVFVERPTGIPDPAAACYSPADGLDLADEPPTIEEVPPLEMEEEPIEDPTITDTGMHGPPLGGQIGIGGGAGGSFASRGHLAGGRQRPAGGSVAESGVVLPASPPVRDVTFRHAGVRPFVDTSRDPLSTFALDVDTASYAIARRFLEAGQRPPAASIRVEEFVNRFPSDDPSPAEDTFGLAGELMPSPFGGPRDHLLRLGLRARGIEHRKPLSLTLVVDVSGSMKGETRLELVRSTLLRLLDRLGPDDRVGLVAFGTSARLVRHQTGDRPSLRNGLRGLTAAGTTNAEEGLVLGYEEAVRAFRPDATNRVILCSDGVANTGLTHPDDLLRRIGEHARAGIELTTLGFGMGNYNDVLMERLADRGNGRYAYVDGANEADRVLEAGLTGGFQVVARDAKVQVEFDPELVSSYRLLGYENRAIADRAFRDDAVDGGEIGANHTVTALYEVKLAGPSGADRPIGTFRVRYRRPDGSRVIEEAVSLPAARAPGPPSRHLRLCAAVAELAEILRKSGWARGSSLGAVSDYLAGVAEEYPGDARIAELVEFVRRAVEIAGPG